MQQSVAMRGNVIAAFLDDRQTQPPLYPKDPAELAMARFWEDWAAQSLYFFEIHFRMLDPTSLEKALDLICAGRPAFERSILKVVFAGATRRSSRLKASAGSRSRRSTGAS